MGRAEGGNFFIAIIFLIFIVIWLVSVFEAERIVTGARASESAQGSGAARRERLGESLLSFGNGRSHWHLLWS
jgi:hypothetical protein